jgi:hypothetical protein
MRATSGRHVCSAVNIITVLFFRSSVDLFPLHPRRLKLLALTRGQTMIAFAPFALAACALRAALCFLKAARNGLLLLLFYTGHNTCAASSLYARRSQVPGRWIATGDDVPALSTGFTALDDFPARMIQAGEMLKPV